MVETSTHPVALTTATGPLAALSAILMEIEGPHPAQSLCPGEYNSSFVRSFRTTIILSHPET